MKVDGGEVGMSICMGRKNCDSSFFYEDFSNLLFFNFMFEYEHEKTCFCICKQQRYKFATLQIRLMSHLVVYCYLAARGAT